MTNKQMKGVLCGLIALLAVVLAVLAWLLFAPQSNTDDEEFTIGWVSDPQWYSFAYNEILTSQNEWIAENFDALDMRYIVHTGDFVDLPHNHEQWQFVSKEYEKWDEADIPYGALAGNHDVDGADCTEFQQYFGSERYEDNPWYGESYDDNRGHYDLMTIGDVEFIFVYLGYGDHTADDLAWLNRVLGEHSERIAVLAFHEYLNAAGVRTSTGDNLFENVVLKNPNVRMVLCGHNYNAVRRVDDVDDNGDGVSDRTVYQMMANYQNLENGGNGFFRIMTCNVKEGTIASVTYSPYLDRYNAFENSNAVRDEYGYQDEFTIPFDFSAPTPKADGDPERGTVVLNPRVSFAGEDGAAALRIPLSYINTAESGETYQNGGVYDRLFSLTATDAFEAYRDLNYIVVMFEKGNGYHVDSVIKGEDLEEAMVAIPQKGVIVAVAKDAVGSDGKPIDVDSIAVGQVVTFSQTSGMTTPIPYTFTTTLTFPWGETYGINGTNRFVTSGQWILFDKAIGDSVADLGSDHQQNLLFAMAPGDAEGEYVITQTATAVGEPKDLAIPENGFVLAINTASGTPLLPDSLCDHLTVGTKVILEK